MASRKEHSEALNHTRRIAAKAEIMVPGVKAIGDKIIAFVDNHKPNFDIFLDVVEARLASEYHVARVVRWRKGSPIRKDLPDYDEIARDSNLALVGSCD